MKQAKNIFNERVWELCKQVPAGYVTTYQELARALGTRAYRAVGNALNKNPHAPIVPCHRVVKSNGTLGGFARGGEAKEALLRKEGVVIKDGCVVDFERKWFRFR